MGLSNDGVYRHSFEVLEMPVEVFRPCPSPVTCAMLELFDI